MPTPYFIIYNDEEELYQNKTKEEKESILPELVEYALKHGNKPAARKYKTYPSTVRKWVRVYNEKGIEGLKFNNKKNNKQNIDI